MSESPASAASPGSADGPRARPLEGLRVVEFSHMVMGPSCGLVLADLGADVVKVEPVPDGDRTRDLPGSGAGFFPLFNRNKRSLAVDLKADAGRAAVCALAARSDVVFDNFGPGTIERLGFGYGALSADNPRLIHASLKGFLSGPYERRTALDEVVQMMGGLAYMTGPPGRPLRAGASVVDIVGGLFGAIAILAALEERRRTGRGQPVRSALFESCALLVGQHMAQAAATGAPPRPMPDRLAAWGVYDVFDTADGQSFVGIVTDAQWRRFCEGLGLADLAADPELATNAGRVAGRDRLLPRLRDVFGAMTSAELAGACERLALPFAPIGRPDDLFDDPHLNATGGLLDVLMSAGVMARLPALPVELGGARPGLHRQPPRVGEHTAALLAELGYSDDRIAALAEAGTVVVDAGAPAAR